MHWNLLLALALTVFSPGLPGSSDSDSLAIEHKGGIVERLQHSDYIHPLPGVPLIDERKLEQLMRSIAQRTENPPVNATLDGAGRIVPERTGTLLDKAEFQRRFLGYIYEGEPSVLQLPFRPAYPRVDTELLASIKVKAIGGYATYYNSRNRNRSSNIVLAANQLNNYVVFPGERFSFNQALGKRTKEKGYLRAPVIVRGELYEDVGGGICQVSSTLFNAVDRAGLTIVERFSHSRSVHYVPPGRDATVSWYGPDFVFENQYSEPILIRAYANAGQMSVSIHTSEFIEARNREVPGASKTLPEEVELQDQPRVLEQTDS